MSFLINGALKSNAGFFTQGQSPFAYASSKDTATAGTFYSGLRLNKSETSTQTESSVRRDPNKDAKRSDVESRASTSLLTSSLEISKRESITDSIASAVNTLNNLNEDINQEVDPLRKSSLITEANTLITDLDTYLTSEFSNDPNLQNSVRVGSSSPSTANDTFSQISIEGVSSVSDLGISSLDFSEYQTTSDALTSASLILSQKQSSYSSSTTIVSSAVSAEISSFNAEVKVLAESEKEQSLNELSNSVAISIFNFTVGSTTPAETVLNLLFDSKEETKNKDQVIHDPSNADIGEDPYDDSTINLSNLSTNESPVSYLDEDSTASEESSISVEA